MPTRTKITQQLFAELSTRSDVELINSARQNDKIALEFLLDKYRYIVWGKIHSYFLIGADRDDLFQEGMIGLYKAVRDYREDKQISFRAFAELCVTRQVITAVKTATRKKHSPLNSYVSLNSSISPDGDTERMLANLIAAGELADPIEIIIGCEELEKLREDFAGSLSELEAKVLGLYLSGRSYHDIADELGRGVKAVDNAVQRIKKKMDVYLKAKANTP